jgi:hypothetical protein
MKKKNTLHLVRVDAVENEEPLVLPAVVRHLRSNRSSSVAHRTLYGRPSDVILTSGAEFVLIANANCDLRLVVELLPAATGGAAISYWLETEALC